MCGGQAVVEITAKAKIERPVSLGDRVLDVEGEFLDVGVAVEGVQASAAGLREVVRKQVLCRERQELRRAYKARETVAHPTERRRGKSGSTMPSVSFSVEECLLVGDARLQVVDALHVGNIRDAGPHW